jgi:choice-of-anchor B domain-containing protein
MKMSVKIKCSLFLAGISLLGAAFTVQAQNKNVTFQSNLKYGTLSNIWGYVDSTGKEYALVGADTALSIVDVSIPSAPVKKFSVPGPRSSWREIRTWGKYAYVTTEGGGGVTIVDLSKLPNTVSSTHYTGDGAVTGKIDQIHALHIDNGKLYLYGGNHQGGRAKVFSLADPMHPVYQGTVSNRYVHDGFVRNDTLYSCQIYDGLLEVIDARDPQNPVVINSQLTPSQFTHNSWMSTDRRVIYTTDEVDGSYVTAYDISDLSNIRELDRYQSNPGSGSIGHNTYVLNDQGITGFHTDFLVTSYYTDGFTIVDAARPDNLVQVANYDTSPLTGPGYNGAWGVYPYLPSGNILISDIQMGMFVLTPEYKRACYLEGTVKDSVTNAAIPNVTITVLSKDELNTSSLINGVFKSGTADAGTYTVSFAKFGYITKVVSGVMLDNGQVTNLDVIMSKRPNYTFEGIVQSGTPNNRLQGATVLLRNAEFTYEVTSDANGMFNIPTFYEGRYGIHAAKEGYRTIFLDSVLYNSQSGTITLDLEEGFYDDFMFRFNWMVTGDAEKGAWEKGKPKGTMLAGVKANPDQDVSDDFGDECYVTGNGGGSSGTDDLDNGTTILTSPWMSLLPYTNPTLNYYRWFFAGGGDGNPDDTLFVKLTDGISTVIVDQVGPKGPSNSTWVFHSVRVKDYFPNAGSVKVIYEVSDLPGNGHIIEAGVDKVYLEEANAVGINPAAQSAKFNMSVYPNPVTENTVITYKLDASQLNAQAKLEVVDLLGRVIQTQKLTQAEGRISLSLDLAKGVYLVKISNGAEQETLTIVK